MKNPAACEPSESYPHLKSATAANRAKLTLWLLGALLAGYVLMLERTLPNMLVAASVTLLIAATIAFFTRRPTFAATITGALVVLVLTAAMVKRYYMKMLLHAYDIVFYLGSLDVLSFLWVGHKGALIALAVVLTGTIAFGWLMYRWDPLRVERGRSLKLIAALAVIAAVGIVNRERVEVSIILKNHGMLSRFYLSWAEIIEEARGGQALAASPAQSEPMFPAASPCTLSERPPHILLIHQESMVPPSYFPKLVYDRSLDPFFLSHDGTLRRLGVEVYGGGSWLTEFSILAGVSTHAFGGMRQFVMSSMQGRLGDALPQALARCGYHNVFFNPMTDGFIGTGPFYRSAGMHETYDRASQGAPGYAERDKFYYANVLKRIDREVSGERRPLFLYVLTNSAHQPYDYVLSPDEKVPAGAADAGPAMNEYLRRVALAKNDLEWLLTELRAKFPSERFLIVQYGDHQPFVTGDLLGIKVANEVYGTVLDPASLGYQTYYSVNALNMLPPALPDVTVLDVPYLGSLVLKMAGLPLSPAHVERLRMLHRCKGRYALCEHPKTVLDFHRRLIDSGLIKLR